MPCKVVSHDKVSHKALHKYQILRRKLHHMIISEPREYVKAYASILYIMLVNGCGLKEACRAALKYINEEGTTVEVRASRYKNRNKKLRIAMPGEMVGEECRKALENVIEGLKAEGLTERKIVEKLANRVKVFCKRKLCISTRDLKRAHEMVNKYLGEVGIGFWGPST